MNTSLEKRWIRKLETLLCNPPSGLWLFAADSTIHVMRYGKDGKRIMTETSMDQKAIVHSCKTKINVDGGAW